MKKEIKEAIENLITEKVSLEQKNQNLFKDNQRLRLELNEAYTKIIKFCKVLEQLITAICYSEDEKLLKTSTEILKVFEEERLWKETSTN